MNLDQEIIFGTKWETAVATVAAKWLYPGSSVFRCAKKADLDFVVIQHNEEVAYFEIKCRRYRSTDFDETIVPESKHIAGKWAAKLMKVPAFYIAYFMLDETLLALNLSRTPERTALFQREGRQKPVPHCWYKMQYFEPIPLGVQVRQEYEKHL